MISSCKLVGKVLVGRKGTLNTGLFILGPCLLANLIALGGGSLAWGEPLPGRAPQPSVADKFTPADPAAVHLEGWLARYLDAVRDEYVLRGDLVDLYLRPLEQHGDQCWQGEHIGKWLDAASAMWKYTGDQRIRELMDQAVKRMLAAQATNGWLGSYDEPYRYYQIKWHELGNPSSWAWSYAWDLWCNFTSLEGLLKYYECVTRDEDRNELNRAPHPGPLPIGWGEGTNSVSDQLGARAWAAACRIGDLFIETFGEGKEDMLLVPHDNGAGAMTLLLGSAQLYEATGEQRYLDFCRYIVCQFGRTNTTPIILAGTRGPAGDRFPFAHEGAVLKHTETELILSGLCELYRITGEPVFIQTCQNVYEAGYAPILETLCLAGYTAPTESIKLPPAVRPKVELCDTPATLRWWVEMFRLTGQARYLDAVERQVYNQLLAHRTVRGDAFSYMPYQHFDSPSGCWRRYGSLGPFDCCWSMGPVAFGDLPRFCYFTSPDGFLVNLYEPSSFRGNVGGTKVELVQKTEYPVEGRVEIEVTPENPTRFALHLRIPGWCEGAVVRVNGRVWRQESSEGGNNSPHAYALLAAGGEGPPPLPAQVVGTVAQKRKAQAGTIMRVEREWRAGDKVELELPMPGRASSPMQTALGFCVIDHGPLVLAMSRRLNERGDGWCYVAPIINSHGRVELERVNLDDPAGQAVVGWQMHGLSRVDSGAKIQTQPVRVTLVPFSDAGLETEPYVAAFPRPETLDQLPPRLGAESERGSLAFRAQATADSQARADTGAENAVDGNQKTAWYAGSVPYPHWIEIKLPKPQKVGKIIVRFGEPRNHPVDFDLMAELKGTNLTEILSVANCNLSDYFWARFESVEAQTFRLIIEKSSGDSDDAPVSEVELYDN